MQVGDYVRTKDGIILKIKDMEDIYTTDNIYIGMSVYDNEGHWFNDVEIIKSSPNIIDLIEVGDYVNDEKIVGISCLTNGPEKGTKAIDYYIAPNTVYYFKNEDIKSIVTKEQFESMEYKV